MVDRRAEALASLKMIRSGIADERADAQRKNEIRKCDIWIHRINLCDKKLDAIDYALELIDGIND